MLKKLCLLLLTVSFLSSATYASGGSTHHSSARIEINVRPQLYEEERDVRGSPRTSQFGNSRTQSPGIGYI
jgi:hypothetical protein